VRLVKVRARVVYHAPRWYVISRRLFLSPVTIAYYLIEPFNLVRRKAGYKTPGIEVHPEIAKTDLTEISLACPI
jgi:hypothetical protein